MPTESPLQAALLIAAPRVLPDLRLFRRNVGAARALHGGHIVQYGIAGQADLYGLVRGGRHVEIELKAATGSLSPEQDSWRNWCIAWGIPHAVLKAKHGEAADQTVARWCEELRGMVGILVGGVPS